jgi:hypothetical protein
MGLQRVVFECSRKGKKRYLKIVSGYREHVQSDGLRWMNIHDFSKMMTVPNRYGVW